jgi:tetratricopeptide (TPR) repeat protein
MRSQRLGIALLLLAALTMAGCADLGLRAACFRAEKLLWQARREEQRMRLGGARPDSAGVARLRALYRRVRDEIPVPPPDTTAPLPTQRLRLSLSRVIGEAELSGTRLALEARRPGEAVEKARWLMTFAGQDTFLRREAHLRVIDALQGLRQYDEAARQMWIALEEYPPVPPRKPDEEDPILKMPELIAMLHQQLGDTAAVRADLRRGIDYFERLLTRHPTPLLEAQVRARLTRAQADAGDRAGALATIEALDRLVSSTPALSSARAEILCSKGDLQAMPGGNPRAAVAAYEEVIKEYPNSPFAPRALVGAAVVEESAGEVKEAIARYRTVLGRYGSDEVNGPIAMFRTAMLRERLGDWQEAKQVLESAPLRYPKTRVAMEAPIAIVQHYQRVHDNQGIRAAFAKAIETYQHLIAADSTNIMNVGFRWNIARCYAALDRWNEALATIDEMSERDHGSELTANAVLEAARICGRLGNEQRRRAYLMRYLADYPSAPQAGTVRAMLESGGAVLGSGGKSRAGRKR